MEMRPTYESTWNISRYETAVDIMPIYAKYLIFFEAVPCTSVMINLKAVIDTQYNEL